MARGGTATFAGGASRARISVPLLTDGTRDGVKTFEVTLSNPTGGATLGASRSGVVG
jgi:hypothetical protein